MVTSHFLMESFRKDVSTDIIPSRCYAARVHREIIEIAVKIVYTGHRIILKLPLQSGKVWMFVVYGTDVTDNLLFAVRF